MPVHLVNFSGGKDSTALYLLAMERLGDDFTPVFADTQHENEHVYEQVERIPRLTGGPKIKVVCADFSADFVRRRENIRKKWPGKHNVSTERIEQICAALHPTGCAFLDLCLLRAGFPSPLARFCTDRLKIQPIKEQVCIPVWRAGKSIIQWLGNRREESPARARQTTFARPSGATRTDGVMRLFRPLLDWTLDDVVGMHRRHNVPMNALYQLGASRVGCMPCIYARQDEIRLLGEKFPDDVERVRWMEREVSKVAVGGVATLLYQKRLPGFTGELNPDHGIDAQIAHAKDRHLRRGGNTQDLFEPSGCEAGYCHS